MGAVKGRDFLVKLKSGDVYSTIGGAREITLTINNEPVDISNADDSGIRKLLENAGMTSVSIKLQGVYVDDQYIGALNDAALANIHKDFQIVQPGSVSNGTYSGTFMVASFELGATHNQAETYSLTLESAGAVAFA